MGRVRNCGYEEDQRTLDGGLVFLFFIVTNRSVVFYYSKVKGVAPCDALLGYNNNYLRSKNDVDLSPVEGLFRPSTSSGTDILADIVRLGKFMTPPFSARNRCGQEHSISKKRNASITGWNTKAYAEKLMRLADIVTIENEKGEIIGLVAAYLNRSDFGFISMLIVMPKYRRCRAAEALCEKVHMLAREKNIPSIRGEIRKENMACRRLAEMMGYVEYKDTGNGFVGVEKRILPE